MPENKCPYDWDCDEDDDDYLDDDPDDCFCDD